MTIQIKNYNNPSIVIYESSSAQNVKECVEEAIRNGVGLQMADLGGANLERAYLKVADLWNADLREANLWRSNLRGADLYETNLWRANLKGADLVRSNLGGANLVRSNLGGANLKGADLKGADLWRANLWRAKYDIPQVMQARWYDISDKLCLEMMRYDCASLDEEDGRKLFAEWKKNGTCPFDKANKVRPLLFQEKKEIWRYDKPKSLEDIFKMIVEDGIIKV
jgi:hypothetical protein